MNFSTENVDHLNDRITNMFPGEVHVSLSADHASDADDFLYPREFLNTLNPSRFPPHELRLKVGCPIILLRNLDFNLGRHSLTLIHMFFITLNIFYVHFASLQL